MTNEAAYWIALANLPRWGPLKINSLIVKFFHENKISIIDFFNLSHSDWKYTYQLNEKQILDLDKAKSELAGNAFLAEYLHSQGFEITPIVSSEYSKTLKKNLTNYAPILLYTKGNKEIMHEQSVAIVGSRAASEIALNFTDKVAKNASKEYKVIVSGFAKGVDRQALDSAINYRGQSIIVLPQGITTFDWGFKKYYKQIIGGDVLVLSTFKPETTWSKKLAMARNPIIYGLADEIYVAESSDKGGTWSGVIDGLKRGRKIYVRNPEQAENNANNILIQKGAIPVDINGNIVLEIRDTTLLDHSSVIPEPTELEVLDNRVRSMLNEGPLTAKELLTKLNLTWTTQELNNYLKERDFIECTKEKSTTLYKLKGANDANQLTLFS